MSVFHISEVEQYEEQNSKCNSVDDKWTKVVLFYIAKQPANHYIRKPSRHCHGDQIRACRRAKVALVQYLDQFI